MAAALECWSSRTSIEEDTVEQVLMRSQDRSEGLLEPSTAAKDLPSSSAMQKRFQRLSRNVSEAISSLKNSLNLDSPRDPPPSKIDGHRKIVWGSVIRSLTQLYPGSQLPEKLVSNIRKHYDSMPLSYAQAGFDMKDVFVHIRLIEQASAEDQPAVVIQEVSDDEVQGVVYKITFACNSSISWPSVSGALENGSICCKKVQIFERKSCTLGILHILVQNGQEKNFKIRIENALKSASKKIKVSNRKLPFGLCGCQEENGRGREFGEIEEEFGDHNYRNSVEGSNETIELSMPLSSTSILVSVDEWQTVRVGGDEIGKWLLNSESFEFGDQIGPSSFKGVYKGKKVAIEKLKGCDMGNAYDFELRKDLLELMTCGHKNVVPFYGVCVDEIHGLCVVTRFMEGGSVHDLMLKHKKLQIKDVMRIAVDVAEGMKFMNDHGVAYRDLNTQRILLDRQGNACLGDLGIVTACKNIGEAMEYETDGYRWLAPEIIAADPESVNETWMSNVYSFGMVVWEMVTGEAAYSAYSPVQAAVGIAACGLRPEIPKDCPQVLRSLMMKCWNNCPSKRPQFSEILSVLLRPNNNITALNNR
ncbi:Serine/threonine-protein kinase STY46 [Bienertia sinuspersici]